MIEFHEVHIFRLNFHRALIDIKFLEPRVLETRYFESELHASKTLSGNSMHRSER